MFFRVICSPVGKHKPSPKKKIIKAGKEAGTVTLQLQPRVVGEMRGY